MIFQSVSGKRILFIIVILFVSPVIILAQGGIKWTSDGNGFYRTEGGEIVRYSLPQQEKTVLVTKQQLTPEGNTPLQVRNFSFSADDKKILVFTNSKKVWRLQTRGD